MHPGIKYAIATLSLVLAFSPALAQLTFKSIDQSVAYQSSAMRTASYERDSTRITLPFWDDFSRTNYLPDTSHWFFDTGSATISSTVGINPPTINVAVFDGWNNQGVPYSTAPLQTGAADSLVSRFIDLSIINPMIYNTMYISFFWQKQGHGEIPDDIDSIRLQVCNASKQWITVWSKTGAQTTETNRFFQEIIQLSDPSYFHNYFQFRFQSFGRLSGGYDTWNIDYVYLNTNRHSGDTAYEDRALSTLPDSWLTKYTAMPYDHFIINLAENLQSTRVLASNLDAQVQAIEYSALIRDSTTIYDVMNEGTPRNLPPRSFLELTSLPVNPLAFDADADTLALRLETKFFINSGDSSNLFNKYDLRVNDTTTSIVLLDNELAYDDGTAEWAAGMSTRSAQLAYRFIIPKPDIITAIKFYFPAFSLSTSINTFTMVIWEDIYQNNAGRLFTEQQILSRSDKINEYTTYTLSRPVGVVDTFYVGYQQDIPDFFAIGLDKDGRFYEGNIFINLDGTWENVQTINGNLMIRPVFGFKQAVGFEEDPFAGIQLYPNPNRGTFLIRGDFEQGWVTDVTGNRLITLSGQAAETEVRMTRAVPGMYFMTLQRRGKYKTLKFVIE